MQHLTVGQVKKAMKKHRYLVFRYKDDDLIGVNSRIINIGKQLKKPNDTETNVVSFYPCSFQEYISKKTPFMGRG